MKIFRLHINLYLKDKIEMFLANSLLSKKILGNKRSIVFVRGITKKLIEHYGCDEKYPTDINSGNLGLGFIHYALILNCKPKRILCVGSQKGFIPSICSLACQENNFGCVDFIDVGYEFENLNYWPGISWWKMVDPNKHFSFLDINKYMTTYLTTTEQFVNKYQYKYQYIYINGDRSDKNVRSDFELFWPKLEKQGLMILHGFKKVDSNSRLPWFNPQKLFQNMEKKNKMTIILSHSSLCILQK